MYFEDEGGRRSYCYCSAFGFFWGGGLDRNEEVGFKHVDFEISCRHPGEMSNEQLDIGVWSWRKHRG